MIGRKAKLQDGLGFAAKLIIVENPVENSKMSKRGLHGSTYWESCYQPIHNMLYLILW